MKSTPPPPLPTVAEGRKIQPLEDKTSGVPTAEVEALLDAILAVEEACQLKGLPRAGVRSFKGPCRLSAFSSRPPARLA